MLDDILIWTSNLVFIMSVVLFMLFYWIVVKKSPIEIKVYKWYIIWNSSLLLIVEIMFAISHPQILYPHLTFVLSKCRFFCIDDHRLNERSQIFTFSGLA
jgi:hypothetical protein